MSVGIYETVKAALEKDDRQYLNNILKICNRSVLLSAVNNTSLFFLAPRNFGAESHIPKYVREKTKKFCTALR
jgi:hypothetical protein